jgi:2',3'-cyclic-nucleotide 2'-phosphodiesterase/3'-nucleotidase
MNINSLIRRVSFFILTVLLTSCSGEKENRVVILETTDVHGVILPYDFIEKEEIDVSLASVTAYLKKARAENETVILLDAGDNLQGQPAVYYYNFIDTVSPHLNAEVMNFMGYDAATAGNHDIEAGHSVYDRLVREYNFPLLAANAVDTKTGNPYFKPYVIVDRNGIRIAVFGLITPDVPSWLPPELYEGIEFRDMLETAKLWMPVIEKEKPDIVAGLFHSGWDDREIEPDGDFSGDAGSATVAREVPGFDVIFNGHDHNTVNKKIINISGDTVLILDGGSKTQKIARADIMITNRKKHKTITGQILDVDEYKADQEFLNEFGSSCQPGSSFNLFAACIQAAITDVLGNGTGE